MSKNTHISHIEDVIILGLCKSNYMLDLLYNTVNKIQYNENNNIKISTKIDGAPSLVAWSSFNGLPNKGVSTKSIFSKTPIYFNTEQEIDDYYKDDITKKTLKYKLKTLLKYIDCINIPEQEIWQGDFLYDDSSLNIDSNKNIISFHPNTILYSVPINSKLGNIINKSNIGIVWHTVYRGVNLSNIQTYYEPVNCTDNSNTLSINSYIDCFDNKFSDLDYIEIVNNLDNIKKTINTLYNNYSNDINVLFNKDIVNLFNIYHNKVIKQSINSNYAKLDIEDFIIFLENRMYKELIKLKTEKSKNNVTEKFNLIKQIILMNSDLLEKFINVINKLVILKHKIIDKLDEYSLFDTHLIYKDNTIAQTKQEGFVISDNNIILKLVNRNNFSKSNFDNNILKGWLI